MKRMSLLKVVVLIAVSFAAAPPKANGPACDEYLIYFKVLWPNYLCNQISTKYHFDYIQQFQDNGDGIPQTGEVLFAYSFSNPYGCPDYTLQACALGYRNSQIFIDTDGLWKPKPDEVTNYQCCVRRGL